MNKRISILVLILSGAVLIAWAHFPTGWAESKLNDVSDLVAIGIPLATRDTPEKSSLGLAVGEQFQSVETDFLVVKTLKGQINTNRLILQHYRDVADTNGINRDILLKLFDGVEQENYSVYERARPGGPLFVRFLPNTNAEYVLYLKKVNNNCFTPATGYLFSFESFRRLPSSRNSPISMPLTNDTHNP